MNAAWITDPHLEFLDEDALDNYLARITKSRAECFLLTGDIGIAPILADILHLLSKASTNRPVYFVLGNHDFYEGSIAEVWKVARRAISSHPNLHWLSESLPIRIASNTALIGHDGWGDARLGNWQTTTVRLNDFDYIRELKGLSRTELVDTLRALGDDAAHHLESVLPKALEIADDIIVLTHVPPFAEAAWYRGNSSDPDYLPYFSCKATGDVLRRTMENAPTKRMIVLCGHTHGGGICTILPNLTVRTGAAQYGKPTIRKIEVKNC
jgi:3',5'-cyclic-AMP phosphodiesterase